MTEFDPGAAYVAALKRQRNEASDAAAIAQANVDRLVFINGQLAAKSQELERVLKLEQATNAELRQKVEAMSTSVKNYITEVS